MTSVALMASARLESPYQGVPDVWVWVIPCHGAVPCTVQVLAESLPGLHPQTQHPAFPPSPGWDNRKDPRMLPNAASRAERPGA